MEGGSGGACLEHLDALAVRAYAFFGQDDVVADVQVDRVAEEIGNLIGQNQPLTDQVDAWSTKGLSGA